MGEVLAFAPRPPAGDWTVNERGLLLLLTQQLASSHGEVDGVFGQTDSGDPWYVVTDANQDVLVHIARIDGQFVVHDAAVDMFHQVGSLWSALRQVFVSGPAGERGGVVVAFNPASREAQSFLSLVIAVGLYLELHDAGFSDAGRLNFETLPGGSDPAIEGFVAKLMSAFNFEGDRSAGRAIPAPGATSEGAPAPPAKPQALPPVAVEAPAGAAAGLAIVKATHEQPSAPEAPAQSHPLFIPASAAATDHTGVRGFTATKAVMMGTAGNDNMVGTPEADVIRGGDGDDRIDGGGAKSGIDRIDGGGGNDRIVMNARVVATGGTGADTFLVSANHPASKADALLGVVLDYSEAKGDHLAVLGKGQMTVVSTAEVSNVLAAQEAVLGEATAHLVTDVTHTVAGARVGFDIDGDGHEDVYILLGGANVSTFRVGSTIDSDHGGAPIDPVGLVGLASTDVDLYGATPASR